MNPSDVQQSSSLTTTSQPMTSVWSYSTADNVEVRRQVNLKCLREPSAYIPTVWQVVTRGLGVAAGVSLYRWIGKVK